MKARHRLVGILFNLINLFFTVQRFCLTAYYLCIINQIKVMSYEGKSSEFGGTEANVRAVDF